MPMITVEYPRGELSPEQKSALAEEMTSVILQIEGGADTPEGRAIAYVRFRELDGGDWYVGGSNEGAFVSASGRLVVELNVPEGSMDQQRKSDCHRAITRAILRVKGVPEAEGAARSVLIQIFEWPEGHLATGGRTSSLMEIARLAKIPADHPLLGFPRAYFEAKDRWFDSVGFPAGTAGRALVMY